MEKSDYHEPVMVREAIEALHIKNPASTDASQGGKARKQQKFIDATVGTGGHSKEIIKAGGTVLGIDSDPEIVAVAEKRLKEVYPERSRGTCPTPFKLVHGNFRNVDQIARENNFSEVDGILFDLGVSNIHLKDLKRGFSFENPEAELDMRLNPETQGVKASDLLNALRQDQLEELFSVTMNNFYAKRLAKRVIQRRNFHPFARVEDLLGLLKTVGSKPGLHPGTLPFLALRIAVNAELENLEEALPKAFSLLREGGRLVIISFHSGEDRIVKNFFKDMETGAKILTEKPILPGAGEVESNPRARSAKMRVLEKS